MRIILIIIFLINSFSGFADQTEKQVLDFSLLQELATLETNHEAEVINKKNFAALLKQDFVFRPTKEHRSEMTSGFQKLEQWAIENLAYSITHQQCDRAVSSVRLLFILGSRVEDQELESFEDGIGLEKKNVALFITTLTLRMAYDDSLPCKQKFLDEFRSISRLQDFVYVKSVHYVPVFSSRLKNPLDVAQRPLLLHSFGKKGALREHVLEKSGMKTDQFSDSSIVVSLFISEKKEVSLSAIQFGGGALSPLQSLSKIQKIWTNRWEF